MTSRHSCKNVGKFTCRAAGSVEGQHCLDSHIHGWHIEGLKHDLKQEKNSMCQLGNQWGGPTASAISVKLRM